MSLILSFSTLGIFTLFILIFLQEFLHHEIVLYFCSEVSFQFILVLICVWVVNHVGKRMRPGRLYVVLWEIRCRHGLRLFQSSLGLVTFLFDLFRLKFLFNLSLFIFPFLSFIFALFFQFFLEFLFLQLSHSGRIHIH